MATIEDDVMDLGERLVQPKFVRPKLGKLVRIRITEFGEHRSIPAEVGSTEPDRPTQPSIPTEYPEPMSGTADGGPFTEPVCDPTLPR